MRLYSQQSGKWIRIDEAALLGMGGEGRVYAVLNDRRLAAKLFDAHKPDRAEKLRVMLDNPPVAVPSGEHTSIAWPCDLLCREPNGPPVGYLMPRVRHARVIDDFYNPPTRLEHCPLFHYGYLLCVARNLAAAVHSLHRRNYVIGDIKQANILVTTNALVTLVDTDSFQVYAPLLGRLYRCPVGTPEYTPPEAYAQPSAEILGLEYDLFGLAVLIFQLLMEGIHPFAGVYATEEDPPPLGERIRMGHFPYRYSQRAAAAERTGTFLRQQAYLMPSVRGIPCVPSKKALPFEVLPPELRSLFLQCFEDGYYNPKQRPDASTWQQALDRARAALVTCSANSQHRYGNHLEACPWCDRARTLLRGHDPFPSKHALDTRPAGTPAAAPIPSPTFAGDPQLRGPAGPGAIPPMPVRPSYRPPGRNPQHTFAWTPILFLGAVFSMLGFLTLNSGPYSVNVPYYPHYFSPEQIETPAPSPALELPRSTPDSTVYQATLSPDGSSVAISSGNVTVWDTLPGGERAMRIPQLSNSHVGAMALSPDSTKLAISDDRPSVTLWARNGSRAVELPRGTVRSLAFSPDGRLLAVGCSDEEEMREELVYLFDASSGEMRGRLLGDYGEMISCICFAPDGKELVALTNGSSSAPEGVKIYCWEVGTGKRLWTQTNNTYVSSLAISREGSELELGGHVDSRRSMRDGVMLVYPPWTGEILGCSPAGTWLATNPEQGVALWRRDQGTWRQKQTLPAKHVLAAVFSANGKQITTVTREKGLEVWSVLTGKRLRQIPVNSLTH